MEQLVAHLRAHALRTDGPFTLRSGAQSSWYLDARITTFSGDGARLAGEAVLAALQPEIAAVGGMTMGADPLALATALVAADTGRMLRAFSIRRQTKDHGTGGRIVGPVGAGDIVAALDDTVTTGGALFEAIDVMGDSGLVVAQVVVLVDRSGGSVGEACRTRNLPFTALVLPEDLGVSDSGVD